jgi:hypothetical protein
MGSQIPKIIGLVLYLSFIVFLYVGAGFITNILFNVEYNQSCVGLDNNTKIGISRFTMVIFWIAFIPLSLLPFVIALGIKLF